MMLYALVQTPADGAHLYRLGEFDSTGDPVVVAFLDGIRAERRIPDDWPDVEGWDFKVTGPLDPSVVEQIGATTYDLTQTEV